MKFILNRDYLFESLKYINNIVVYNNTEYEIIKNVFIKIYNNYILIIGTNIMLETNIKIPIFKQDKETINKNILISFKKIFNICKYIDKKTLIIFEINNKTLNIVTNKTVYDILLYNSNNYPLLIFNDNKILEFSINKNNIVELIQKTYFSIGDNDIRNYLNNLLLKIKNKEIIAISTDSYRMSVNKIYINYNIEKEIKILINRKIIIDLYKLLNIIKEDILNINIFNNYINIYTENINILFLISKEQFPKCSHILDQHREYIICIEKNILKNAILRIISIFENSKLPLLKIIIDKNFIKLNSIISNDEKSEEILKHNLISQNILEEYIIIINSLYIIESLEHIDSEYVNIYFSKNIISLKIENTNNINNINIIMPIKI